jgi:hypothetical protein
MLKIIMLSLMALGLACTVSAQDTTSHNDETLVKSVSLSDLQAIVMSLGHEILSDDPDGVTVFAEDEDGAKYVLDGTACNESKACQGINMFMTYEMTEAITLESLNAASLAYAAVSVWKDGDTVGISRYVILDGGMTVGNIKVNIDTLTALGSVVMMKVQPSEPDFGDDSGSYAHDDTCDDVRFTGPGRSILLTDSHIRKDASDCKTAYEAGTISVK